MEESIRGYSKGVGEKKMKKGLTAEQLDRCRRKKKMIYKVRSAFRKVDSLKGKVKQGRKGSLGSEYICTLCTR